MRSLVYALLLPLSFAATAADPGPELERLYRALDMLNQQQQEIYQHFQMVQEVQRSSSVLPTPGAPVLSPLGGQIVNYDEAVAAQRNAIERRESLSRRADELLTKYNDIETLKAPLRARIYELTLSPSRE